MKPSTMLMAVLSGMVMWLASIPAHACEGVNTPCNKNVTFQVTLWDAKTISPALLAQFVQVGKVESNATYAFTPGSGSRDLGKHLFEEWQAGTAKGIRVPLSGSATVPTLGTRSFTATPGASSKTPTLTYYTWVVPANELRAMTDPQFVVVAPPPPGCTIVYPVPPKSHVLTTRLKNGDGENEIWAAVSPQLKAGAGARFRMNFLYTC